MDEYISKHEAYKMMKDLEAAYIYPPVKEAYGTAARRIDQIPAADVQPVNQWISCKDKMPEDNTSVLFVYVSENGIKSVHYGYHQTLKGLGSSWAKPSGGWQYCDDDVTHWQPLPEPPKDDDEQELLLRESLPILHRAFFANYQDQDKCDELRDKIGEVVGRKDNENNS